MLLSTSLAAFEIVYLVSSQPNKWLLLAVPFLLPSPCISCLNKMCFSPWQDLYLSRHETVVILTKILCFLALAIQELCRVTPMSSTFKIKVILN